MCTRPRNLGQVCTSASALGREVSARCAPGLCTRPRSLGQKCTSAVHSAEEKCTRPRSLGQVCTSAVHSAEQKCTRPRSPRPGVHLGSALGREVSARCAPRQCTRPSKSALGREVSARCAPRQCTRPRKCALGREVSARCAPRLCTRPSKSALRREVSARCAPRLCTRPSKSALGREVSARCAHLGCALGRGNVHSAEKSRPCAHLGSALGRGNVHSAEKSRPCAHLGSALGRGNVHSAEKSRPCAHLGSALGRGNVHSAEKSRPCAHLGSALGRGNVHSAEKSRPCAHLGCALGRGNVHSDERSREVFSWSSAKDSIRCSVGIVLQGGPSDSSARGLDLRHVPLGAGQPDSQTAPRGATGSGHDGALTLSGAPFQGTWARSAAEDASPDYNSSAVGARFSSWAFPGSLAVTKGILLATASSADDFIFGQPQGSSETPGGQHPLPSPRGDWATLRDTQADVPSTGWLRAQLAFKNSMVHGILQFTPSIAFRYVLHRCESRDIRCRESL
ncbi:unnamed protein product [Linum tenue]|uniref:Uncharacterized protein n=2 Tax=Linum tenue TaxID=586396 RepID=A0AAV0L0G9_9ROSI|nr:unnamed protein product [Linum tenue]